MNDTRPSLIVRIILWIRGWFSSDETGDTKDSELEVGRAPGGASQLDNKLEVQIQVIRDAFGDQVAVAKERPSSDGALEFVYRRGYLLVASDRLDELRGFFASNADTYDGVGQAREGSLGDLTLYQLPNFRGKPSGDLDTFKSVEAALGAGAISPDHVVYVTPVRGGLCPATEPDAPHRDLPWPRETRDSDRGAGVMINVVDTGWWKPASQDPEAPWLSNGVDGDAEQINPAAIHPYGGHGTFVAGVIRCQAPQAEIYVDGMLTQGGAIFESELMKQLDIAVLSGDAPNIVSISGGTHTYNDQPLMTFVELARKHNLVDNPNAPLIVAAAGNDSTDAPFWPAAFDWVVGVGSLDRDDTVSDYSNYGDWVDIYALGRDHVNAYPTGTYTCYEPPNVGEIRHFQNLAKWSGTSFSTPLITGLIAGLMTEHGLTAHEAWARLKTHGIPRTDANAGDILTVDTPGD